MEYILAYLVIGSVYSLYLLVEAFTGKVRKNREYWLGILIMGTLFWPIDLFVSFVEYRECKMKRRV